MVERYADPTDRRCKRLKLASAGHDTLALAEPLASRSQRLLVACLTDSEQKQLLALMQKVVDALGNKSRTSRPL